MRYKKQISHQTVANVLNKFERTGAATTLPKAGRSRAFNPEQTEMMIEMIEKTPLKTLDEFTAMVNEKIKTADRKTVRRALLEKGFKAYAVKKSEISEVNRKLREKWTVGIRLPSLMNQIHFQIGLKTWW